jgi:hypothetical protein
MTKRKEIIKSEKTSYKINTKKIDLLEKAQRDEARNYSEVYEKEKRSLFFK